LPRTPSHSPDKQLNVRPDVLAFAAVPPRILILTASVGEGHDLPARTLAAQLREEQPGVELVTEDCLVAMGRAVAAVSEGAARVVFYRFEWLWDIGFWLFAGAAPTRELSQRLITRFGSPGLLRLIERHDPDVIVSVYPNVTEVLGRLKRSGRLRIPVVAAITDLAAMHYWASKGVDVHLVTHPESIGEVRTIVGRDASVHCVHGFTLPAFHEPRDEGDARRALGLPETGKIVLASGGGWGVGDVAGTVEEALAVSGVTQVVCLCGRNDDLRQELSAQFAGEERVRVEGFTDQMPDWMAGGDVLVHSTGGLTVLEALMRGCPAISYGWGRGHVRVNNAAFRRFGLADVVDNRVELRGAIERALANGRTSTHSFDRLPSAASFVLAAAHAG
jgi:UDP-N-acetylglucosamine:LPS N-acetylglucosamine transferase